MSKRPDLRHERKLWKLGMSFIAGVDEAGVGPMAGPVVAAAVIFAPETFINGVHDSKQLTAPKREALFARINETALAVGVGLAEVEEIDRLNIYWACVEATRRAIDLLSPAPDHVLLDGRRTLPGLGLKQTAMVGGDRRCFAIAAASIIAKVTRDRLMLECDRRFPGYGFADHKGYCTAAHLKALRDLGPSPIHRRSFAPVIDAQQLSLL